jgi:hypothetical protein
MSVLKYPQKSIFMILAMIFLAGCGGPAAKSTQPLTLLPSAPPLPNFTPPTTAQHESQTGQPRACPPGEQSNLFILRSIDHGATWASLGNACMREANGVQIADTTPLIIDGHIVLYFVDLAHLDRPVPQSIYRSESTDGVHFDKPQPAYTQTQAMVDPFVLGMPNGSFRLYVPSGPEGIISAVSSDSITFKREGVVYSGEGGGMPGALLLPDGKVRLFIDGGPNSQGLVSLVSEDGRNFTRESGVRIPKPADYLTINNPEPIRLMDGRYLMLYQTQDKKHEGRPEWMAEIHLATSMDGFNWVADPRIIGYGGTSCAVEARDGTLFIYY